METSNAPLKTFRVWGSDRALGALGIGALFVIEVQAVDAQTAERIARESRYAANREHVHVYAVRAPGDDRPGHVPNI